MRNGPGCSDGRGFRRRGRPRRRRSVEEGFIGRCYEPCCEEDPGKEPVILHQDELEILRLVDVAGLTQEEAASAVGVSRRTLWKDLHDTRKKVASALIHGKRIEIEGCRRYCPREEKAYSVQESGADS
jgi:predicted DNA-binding protein (UPF0251 family)